MTVADCGSLWLAVGGCGWLWVVAYFSIALIRTYSVFLLL